MFEIRVGSQSVVYTGDFNMTPDRHLGSAWIDRVRPDLLITESTYCTFVRDSKVVSTRVVLSLVVRLKKIFFFPSAFAKRPFWLVFMLLLKRAARC